MVSVQADCSLPCALTRLQSCARRTRQDIDDVAVAVVERRLRFDHPPKPSHPHPTSN